MQVRVVAFFSGNFQFPVDRVSSLHVNEQEIMKPFTILEENLNDFVGAGRLYQSFKTASSKIKNASFFYIHWEQNP